MSPSAPLRFMAWGSFGCASTFRFVVSVALFLILLMNVLLSASVISAWHTVDVHTNTSTSRQVWNRFRYLIVYSPCAGWSFGGSFFVVRLFRRLHRFVR